MLRCVLGGKYTHEQFGIHRPTSVKVFANKRGTRRLASVVGGRQIFSYLLCSSRLPGRKHKWPGLDEFHLGPATQHICRFYPYLIVGTVRFSAGPKVPLRVPPRIAEFGP